MSKSSSLHAFVRSSFGILAALGAAASLACSFSHSSDSSSDSSNNSSDSSTSSSHSSSPDHHDNDNKSNEQTRFDSDVEHYTVAFLEAGGKEDESFLSGVGDLARQHGVSDWESDPGVWEAIGRGLAKSPASSAERIAYQTAWTGGDAARQSAVAKGLATAQ